MDISVLIGSCDAYSPLWRNFDILFQRYWKLSTKNYLVSETISYENSHYITITPGKKSWGERMLIALNQIKTEYVYFILDDYYLTEPISAEFISEHIQLMNYYNANKIMTDIDYGPDIYKLIHITDDIYQFSNESDYLNSIQPSIWRTDYLRQVLRPEYSPWNFEIEGNEITKKYNPIILLKARLNHMYFNFVRIGGNISEGWEQLYINENLE